MNFILSIKNQKPLPLNYRLTKIPETLERLQIHEFGEKAILNFDLLKYMLLETHYDEQLQVLFKQLSDDSSKCWDFINEFIDYEETQKIFVKRIASAWPGLWESVYYNNALTYTRKIKYIELLFNYTDISILKLQNQDGLISKFFVEHDDILKRLPYYLEKRSTEIIPALNIVFVKIEIEDVSHKVLDINDLFQLLAQGGTYSVPVAYDYFCEELENILYFRFGLKDTIDEVGITSSMEKEMLRSAVTAVSHIVYLNRCFLVLEEQKS